MPKIDRLPPKAGAWSITKKQVIASELSRAIRLFIVEEDMVSAHLLVGAARDIIHARAKALGKPTVWGTMKDRIRDDMQAQFFSLLKDEYNFFKHADRDGDVVSDYYTPTITEMFIWEASLDFGLIYGEQYLEIVLFEAWFNSRHPNMLKAEYRKAWEDFRSREPKANYDSEGRMTRAAFTRMLKAADEAKPGELSMPLLSQAGAKPPAVREG